MKLLFSLSAVLLLSVPAHAANPLTRAEQTVCRDLSHCLSIVDAHPHDSYDYAVLAQEFARFGAKGHLALVKRIGKPEAGAGHAADLLAVISDRQAAPALSTLIERSSGETRALAQRTLEAVTSSGSTPPSLQTMTLTLNRSRPICALGQPVDPAAQKREMPFYEADVARPDAQGRYRPSPSLRIALARTDRAQLNSAVSRIGGWLAGYDGGLIRYDAATGAPTAVLDRPIHSLQRMNPADVTSPVWALSQTEDGLGIIDARSSRPQLKAILPGRLAELRRGPDGSLYASSEGRATVRLYPDGRIKSGCSADQAS